MREEFSHPGPCDSLLPDGGCAECEAQRVGFRGPPKTRQQFLMAALADAEAGVDALRKGEPLAADIFLKLALDYIAESGVLP